jgi:hypothetical protein
LRFEITREWQNHDDGQSLARGVILPKVYRHDKRWPRPHLFVTSAISSLRQIDENDIATRHGSIQSIFKI